MKDRLYRVLVNRVPGIRDRFQKKRQQKGGSRWCALFYLLWLNVAYYLLFRHSLWWPERAAAYEEKQLNHATSESARFCRESPQAFAEQLVKYDVISFDVFDTLIFRPFSNPTDLFDWIGMELEYPKFKYLRIEAEKQARRNKHKQEGSWEVTLEEIWEELERETGIPKQKGMQTEWEWEKRCCWANPYLLCVVTELQKKGKRLIATSDMYLGKEYIIPLLKKCGYGKFEKYFVSCDEKESKSGGGLYRRIKENMGEGIAFAHVGDHVRSDLHQAREQGLHAYWYQNVHQAGKRYRSEDLSQLTGSLYRGMVNTHIYSGLLVFSREYEYGFIYGGLFVAGYCRFLHHYVQQHKIQKVLFLSRDGAVLLEAYRRMYPEEKERTEYGYWSRTAAVKLTAQYFKNEYFERFLFHKVNQQYTIRQALQGMELKTMLNPLCQKTKIEPDTLLTHKNVDRVKKYLMDCWQQVLAQYQEQQRAAKAYYGELLCGCQTVAAVDIGWAGSGALMLDCAVNRIWNLECSVTGILAGTSSCLSPEADAVEPFLYKKKLVSYLYSPWKNRDLWKYHDAAKNHNLYWEMLLGAPEGSLKGFYLDDQGNWECRFKPNPANGGKIREIHRGILDFVQQLLQLEERLGSKLFISGRDAYAPMVSVCSRKNKKFMKDLEELCDEIHIG